MSQQAHALGNGTTPAGSDPLSPATTAEPSVADGESPARTLPEVRSIAFGESRPSLAVDAPAGYPAGDLARVLGVEPGRPVIVVAGGAERLDDALVPRLAQLFARGVAKAAVETGALVVDGGTHAGIMAVTGRALADRGAERLLLGVAPAGKVSYPGGPVAELTPESAPLDPHHGFFVLAEGNSWGSETDTLFAVAEAVAAPGRVVTLLVDGGSGARREVLRSVRRGWPVIVVEGTGRLAEDIARLQRDPGGAGVADPELVEIVEDGSIRLFSVDAPPAEMERLLLRHLTDETPLRLAWERFALYDANAVQGRRVFERLQFWTVALGIVGTVLALTQAQIRQSVPGLESTVMGGQVLLGLRYGIILVPIVISVLLGVLARGKTGSRWVLLRAAAEAIKREIFRYRTRTGIYSPRETKRTPAEVKLVRQIERASRQLVHSEGNASALKPYVGPIPPRMDAASGPDDGLSRLTGDQYLSIRVADQLNFYRSKGQALSRKLSRLQWLMLGASGAGTFLAAIGLELWVALATSLVTALGGLLQYRQVEQTLIKYNQAEANLASLRAWWIALPPEDQLGQEHLDKLVMTGEEALEAEIVGWVQLMRDALTDLEKEDDQAQARSATPHETIEPNRRRAG